MLKEKYKLTERNEMHWNGLRKTNRINELDEMPWKGDDPAHNPNMTAEEKQLLEEKGLLDKYDLTCPEE